MVDVTYPTAIVRWNVEEIFVFYSLKRYNFSKGHMKVLAQLSFVFPCEEKKNFFISFSTSRPWNFKHLPPRDEKQTWFVILVWRICAAIDTYPLYLLFFKLALWMKLSLLIDSIIILFSSLYFCVCQSFFLFLFFSPSLYNCTL